MHMIYVFTLVYVYIFLLCVKCILYAYAIRCGNRHNSCSQWFEQLNLYWPRTCNAVALRGQKLDEFLLIPFPSFELSSKNKKVRFRLIQS